MLNSFISYLDQLKDDCERILKIMEEVLSVPPYDLKNNWVIGI